MVKKYKRFTWALMRAFPTLTFGRATESIARYIEQRKRFLEGCGNWERAYETHKHYFSVAFKQRHLTSANALVVEEHRKALEQIHLDSGKKITHEYKSPDDKRMKAVLEACISWCFNNSVLAGDVFLDIAVKANIKELTLQCVWTDPFKHPIENTMHFEVVLKMEGNKLDFAYTVKKLPEHQSSNPTLASADLVIAIANASKHMTTILGFED